ncbi:MAG: hypothetical protein KY475_25430 [Planctomycetes bacterium]|nr:hypothetical protein [Planctomycetota bacterium]
MEYAILMLQEGDFYRRLWPLTAWVALQSLVAVWAAVSRQHWALRAAGVWAAVALHAFIQAYELVWLFTTTSLLIIVLLKVEQRSHTHEQKAIAPKSVNGGRAYRFGLRDAFAVMLVAGLWLAILIPAARNVRPESWIGWSVTSGAIAALAALSCACVTGGRPRIAWVALVCAVPLLAIALWAAGDWFGFDRVIGVWWDVSKLPSAMAMLVLGGGLTAGIVMAFVALAQKAAAAGAIRRRFVYRIAMASGLLAVAAVPAQVYWRWATPGPSVARFEVPANNYQRILKIAQQVSLLNELTRAVADLAYLEPDNPTPKLLGPLYDEVVQLLDRSNAVDYDPVRDANPRYDENRYPRARLFRRLAGCLLVESESARVNDRMETAITFAVAVVRLGTMLRRGGTGVDVSMGVTIEEIGYEQLAGLRAEFSAEQSRRVLTDLVRSQNEPEEVSAIHARETQFHHFAYGWRGKLERAIEGSSQPSIIEVLDLEAEARRAAAINQLLQTDLALRLYQQEYGRLPEALQHLAPAYLVSTPRDPYTGQLPIYRPAEDEFVLYSVGWDRQDNGGAFVEKRAYEIAEAADEPGLDLHLGYFPERHSALLLAPFPVRLLREPLVEP